MEEQTKLKLKERLIVRQKAQHEFSAGLLCALSLLLFATLLLGLWYSSKYGKLRWQSNVKAQAKEQIATGSAPEELSFNFLGSLEASEGLRRYLDSQSVDHLLGRLTPYLQDGTSNILVLEGPLALDSNEKECFYLDDLTALEQLNFKLIPAANPYFSAPKGEPSLAQQEAMDDKELTFIGIGKNLNDAARGVRYEEGKLAVSFFSASAIGRDQRASRLEPGMAMASDIQVYDRVTRAKINGDFVVVSLHWGNLLGADFGINQQQIAKSYVDAGADLVIGATRGPAMPMEEYRGSLICYNLGSLLQDSSQGQKTPSLLMQMILNQDAPQLRFFPLSQNYGIPEFSVSWQADILKERFLQNVTELRTLTHDDGSFTVYFPESSRR